MVELRCNSLDLALVLGAHLPGTQNHAETMARDGDLIRVLYSEQLPALYWRWQLGKIERVAASRTSPRRSK
jgi:hypothetical protein